MSVNRLDFWNLEEELTPYELMQHYVAHQVEPLGEDRLDIALAIFAAMLIQSNAGKLLNHEQVDGIFTAMTNYLKLRPEETVSGDQAARMFGAL